MTKVIYMARTVEFIGSKYPHEMQDMIDRGEVKSSHRTGQNYLLVEDSE